MDTKIGGSKKKRAPAKRSKSKSRSAKTAKPKAKAKPKPKPRAKANPKPKGRKRAPPLTMAQLENAIRRKNQGDRTAFNKALAASENFQLMNDMDFAGVPMEEKQRFIRKRPLSAKATKALLFDLYGPPKPAPAPLPLNASPTRRLLFDIYGQ